MPGPNGWSDPMRWIAIVASLIIAFSGIIYGATGRSSDEISLNASRKAQLALEMARENKTAVEVIKAELHHHTQLLTEIRDELKDHAR